MTAPFALLAEVPAPPVTDRTPMHTFDRLRQLNVTQTGDAVVDVADVQAPSHTHNSEGWKKDDDWSTPYLLFGPSYTHNSEGRKKDDD
ncbi:hypothetical protein JL475_30020 [Streptomyces sp. M2CJ-2]|uniref:hypothetical protein n=1 Tax=Streptomyces sp. M2CJ-2 TaxID=2803948 RepID=UPI0019255B36|nr:hypothetical protein [Streptomyces sp. M2CJ-2]MBL3670142.1 hypothetical protein [Streptomyces sp. M2CJ-2]